MAERKNKPGEGALFHNNDRNPHPKAPGYRGRMTCPCCQEELKISAWKRNSESNVEYLRMNIDQYKPADATPPADQDRTPTDDAGRNF